MKRNKGKKNCTLGAICGNTCISQLRTCRVSKTPEIKAKVLDAVLAVKAAEKAAVAKEKKAIEAVKAVRARAPKEVKVTTAKPKEVKDTAAKAKADKAKADKAKAATAKPKEVKATTAKPTATEAVKDTATKAGDQLGRGAFGSVTLNADGTVTKTYTKQVTEQSQKNEAYLQSKASEIGLAPKVISTGKNSITMERAKGAVASSFDMKTQVMIAEKVTDSLRELHKIGIAHNDVHPGNVFYDPATGKVQLIDYGNSSNSSKDISYEKEFFNI